MKKTFVAPLLRQESSLLDLTKFTSVGTGGP
jgi:hypothetical protein